MALSKDSLETVANFVQFISMFLEVVGIGLAFIDLRVRPLALRIENWIGVADRRVRDFAYKFLEHKSFSTLVTLFVFFIFCLEIPTVFDLWGNLGDTQAEKDRIADIVFALQMVALPIVALFFLGMFVIIVSAWITSLNKFSEGHAIGSLGVFIASMGLLGELYQVIYIVWFQ